MNKEWFVFKGSHHVGPFSIEEMEISFKEGAISAQTLVWKEGLEKWEAFSSIKTFHFIFDPSLEGMSPPPIPNIPALPKFQKNTHPEIPAFQSIEDDLPPPVPLDAILNPSGDSKFSLFTDDKKIKSKKWTLVAGAFIFIIVVAWFVQNQQNAGVQLKIKGLMPVYLEKLDQMATKNSSHFEVALALSLDGLTLWGSSNYPGVISTNIELKSIPKRVLGIDDVTVKVKGQLVDHIGKFNRMVLADGSKFLPGEYKVHIEAYEIHFLNRNFRSLSSMPFFKSLNKTYVFNDKTLIYSGTPREFEKRLFDYSASIEVEILKPYQDKLERIQTFESMLNEVSQSYLMILDKAKMGKNISLFEAKFIKEISPLLQVLVVKANELSADPKLSAADIGPNAIATYRDQVLIGKQIGELASDMITKTTVIKKLTEKDKSDLKSEFDKRAKAIKVQIDMNIKKLEAQIQKISR